MTNYSKMNDRDIDRLVLKVIYGVHAYDKDIQGCWSRGGFKYTTNPTDAMPIIIENRIGIIPAPEKGLWKAAHRKIGNDSTPYHMTQDENPLRAAMIVFLQMQENNHD